MSFFKTVQVDALTQLPNRAGWLTAVEKSLELSEKQDSMSMKAILFIDLDRFKWVNDTLGHDAGDLLLKKVASLLESVLNLSHEQADIAGRFGGDEFVVLLQSPESIANVETIANLIVDKVSQPICLESIHGSESVEVEIGASIGISSYPQDGEVLEELLKQADLAMYRAKHSGRNQVVLYKPEMLRQIERRRFIQTQLRYAIKEDLLTLDYLPVYDCISQSIVSIEAVLNLQNCPKLASLDIAELFSIADESQVAITLSEWMLKEVFVFNQKLAQSGIEVAFILEIRPSHFQQKNFVQALADQFLQYDFSPENLTLLLNDTCLNAKRFSVMNQLTELSSLGVEIALKGFGSGSWSLLRLHDWPIDCLQISSRFVREITNSSSMEAMTGALIGMGNALNKKVMAYGVATAEQLAFLNSHQCYLIQGLFFSDLMSELEMEACLLQKNIDNSLQASAFYDVFANEDKLEAKLDRGEIKKNGL